MSLPAQVGLGSLAQVGLGSLLAGMTYSFNPRPPAGGAGAGAKAAAAVSAALDGRMRWTDRPSNAARPAVTVMAGGGGGGCCSCCMVAWAAAAHAAEGHLGVAAW